MATLIIATRNEHKVAEIRGILGPAYHYLTLMDIAAAPEVVEDAPTFEGNATKKAVVLAKFLTEVELWPKAPAAGLDDRYVLADDSGLEVDVLNGAPGVHSARFAAFAGGRKGNSPDAENNARLLTLLADAPWETRTARFRCVVALTPVLQAHVESASPVCWADEYEMQTRIFQGACEGRIGFAPKGQGGFGYDPLFIPDGHELTFAELGQQVKNGLSHRARALAALKTALAKAG